MNKKIKSFLVNSKGATMIEYGLIAALIVLALTIALNSLGDETGTMYDTINNAVVDALRRQTP